MKGVVGSGATTGVSFFVGYSWPTTIQGLVAEVRIGKKRGFSAHIVIMEVELTDLLGPIPHT